MNITIDITNDIVKQSLEKYIDNEIERLDIWESDSLADKVYTIVELELDSILKSRLEIIKIEVEEQIATSLTGIVKEILSEKLTS